LSCWKDLKAPLSAEPFSSLAQPVTLMRREAALGFDERNRLIVPVSSKVGLREIASLKWSMVMGADGKVGVPSSRFDLLSPSMILYLGRLVPTSDQVSDRLFTIMH
jgi:hypothetical protein